jgi:hypothetical protein
VKKCQVLSLLAHKIQPNSKNLATFWLWFIWTMEEFTQQGRPKRNWVFPDSNTRRNHRMARILYHLTLLFGWLKTQLERREYNGEDKLYEAVDEILTDLSVGMIEAVFVDWMNRLQRLINGNGDYVS